MKISFLGGGNMASALIGGMIKKGFDASGIQVVELNEENRARLTREFGVRAIGTVDSGFLASDVIVLAVKPQQAREALGSLAGRLSGQLLISIAAGLRLADISRWLGGHAYLVRAMPNTPALIGQGMTGLFAPAAATVAQRELATRIMDAVGQSVWVEEEDLIDAVTALSGSGPAYVFHFIEALQAAGEKLGLPSEVALKLALGTLTGASALAAGSPESPAVLRERVTSKGGTTEAALRSMAGDDFCGLIERALAAAATRGGELAALMGKD